MHFSLFLLSNETYNEFSEDYFILIVLNIAYFNHFHVCFGCFYRKNILKNRKLMKKVVFYFKMAFKVTILKLLQKYFYHKQIEMNISIEMYLLFIAKLILHLLRCIKMK